MRKELTITLEDRGNPLTFRIREMPATKLESWLIRAILLLASRGADTPEPPGMPDGADMRKAGAWIAGNGLGALGGVDYDKARPLLDELLSCCRRVMADGLELDVTPATADGFIEDVTTLFRLRMEALKLNFGFFNEGGPSTSGTEKTAGAA